MNLLYHLYPMFQLLTFPLNPGSQLEMRILFSRAMSGLESYRGSVNHASIAVAIRPFTSGGICTLQANYPPFQAWDLHDRVVEPILSLDIDRQNCLSRIRWARFKKQAGQKRKKANASRLCCSSEVEALTSG
jgi:hypothetical protein